MKSLKYPEWKVDLTLETRCSNSGYFEQGNDAFFF